MIIDFFKKNYLNIIIIIILVIILFIISSTLFLYFSYQIYNLVKKYINNYKSLAFNKDYNDNSKKTLEIYGNYKIRKIYIVYNKMNGIALYGLNLLSLFTCKKTINSVIKDLKNKNKEFDFNHASLIFELKINKTQSKFIYLNKDIHLDITTNFNMNNSKHIIPIKLYDKTKTFKNILDSTEKRVGKEKFFNWNGFDYECHSFTKDILISLGLSKYCKNKFHFTAKDSKFFIDSLNSKNNEYGYYLYNFFMNNNGSKIYNMIRYLITN